MLAQATITSPRAFNRLSARELFKTRQAKPPEPMELTP